MKVTTIGRKVSLKDNFLNRVEDRLGKLDKFFTDNAEATVTVTVEKKWQTVEIAIKDRKLQFRSEKSADSMELALEDAVDNLESQIIKNKEKIHRKFNGYAYFDDLPVMEGEEEDDYEIVRKKVFALQPQSVDDAILEMNMLGHTFFMFKDIVTEEINVVYKRKDGNYGLLIPE
ncbi:MAG: ribosome-associated translation inhibitor RaiA [Oscillospiraceae bacterium]|nr:ribosome-associated translation inhibitor RaiA [Oscillospiraceae bacterium]